jgi:hypothetical protein
MGPTARKGGDAECAFGKEGSRIFGYVIMLLTVQQESSGVIIGPAHHQPEVCVILIETCQHYG